MQVTRTGMAAYISASWRARALALNNRWRSTAWGVWFVCSTKLPLLSTMCLYPSCGRAGAASAASASVGIRITWWSAISTLAKPS